MGWWLLYLLMLLASWDLNRPAHDWLAHHESAKDESTKIAVLVNQRTTRLTPSIGGMVCPFFFVFSSFV